MGLVFLLSGCGDEPEEGEQEHRQMRTDYADQPAPQQPPAYADQWRGQYGYRPPAGPGQQSYGGQPYGGQRYQGQQPYQQPYQGQQYQGQQYQGQQYQPPPQTAPAPSSNPWSTGRRSAPAYGQPGQRQDYGGTQGWQSYGQQPDYGRRGYSQPEYAQPRYRPLDEDEREPRRYEERQYREPYRAPYNRLEGSSQRPGYQQQPYSGGLGYPGYSSPYGGYGYGTVPGYPGIAPLYGIPGTTLPVY